MIEFFKSQKDMKRQAGRPSKNNSATLLQNFGGKTTREIIAAESGESHEQVRKYIRLTNLVPELLEFVDEIGRAHV